MTLRLTGQTYGNTELTRGHFTIYHAMDKKKSLQNLGAESCEFDIRITLDRDYDFALADLAQFTRRMDDFWMTGKMKYGHISGIEVGENGKIPELIGEHHVHIMIVLYNRTSNRSMIKHLQLDGYHGFYCANRNKEYPITGQLEYHSKMTTKVQGQPAIHKSWGTFPVTRRRRTPEEREEDEQNGKKQRNDSWKRKKQLIIAADWEKLDDEFPGFRFCSAGKNMVDYYNRQRRDEHNANLDGELDNYIIWGPTGTGKSSSVAFLYPNAYKKQKGTHFWDGYDRTDPNHKVVWIDEMSLETMKTISGKADGGFEFFKELGDRYPIFVDQKYNKGEYIRPRSVIVTMNEHPTSLLPERASAINKEALYRKFRIMHVSEWLHMNGLVCTNQGVRRAEIIEVSDSEATETITVTSVEPKERGFSFVKEYFDQQAFKHLK